MDESSGITLGCTRELDVLALDEEPGIALNWRRIIRTMQNANAAPEFLRQRGQLGEGRVLRALATLMNNAIRS
ncbi:MAG: hypothetical protein MK095_04710 [Phycisphaerales bacterium]|nr:hypothetical protein [Phycisphaerales bacterium]